MKRAEITRAGHSIIVAVFVNDSRTDFHECNTQADAINWLEENHFDCQSLHIDTMIKQERSYWDKLYNFGEYRTEFSRGMGAFFAGLPYDENESVNWTDGWYKASLLDCST